MSVMIDKYWCSEGCGFVGENHRCEQWCSLTRIPYEALLALKPDTFFEDIVQATKQTNTFSEACELLDAKELDIRKIISLWAMRHSGKYESADISHRDLAKDILQYTEDYHIKQCTKCTKSGLKPYLDVNEFYEDIQMTVWILTEYGYSYDDRWENIIGVFSDKAKMQEIHDARKSKMESEKADRDAKMQIYLTKYNEMIDSNEIYIEEEYDNLMKLYPDDSDYLEDWYGLTIKELELNKVTIPL